MLGISSDGDERLLSAMKSRTRFDLTTSTNLSQLSILWPINVQDTIHIATKLRNRHLNTSILLQMGNMVVTAAHIRMMLSLVPKEYHGLVLSDVSPLDRQNFSSFEKITEQRVLQSLENHIADSNATVMYLVLCKQTTSSFLDVNLKPLERVYRIWHAVYFFRCWRKWIKSPHNNFSLDKNFLSNNAYTCVEINAHALIHLIVSLRTSQQNEFFLPELFSSQPCEHTFRQMRSMGTANFTKINFNLHELMHMIGRVEIMDNIVHTCKDITFPRIELKSKIVEQTAVDNNLPNDEDIICTMKRAQSDALKNAAKFDMCFSEKDIESCELQERTRQNDETPMEEDFFDLLKQSMADETRAENEIEKMVEVINPDGSKRFLRKSTLVWLLCDSKDKLSSDRLKRVQSASDSSSKRFKPNTPDVSQSTQPVFKSQILEIGEWAIFQHNDQSFGESSNVTNISMNNFLFGFVIGFRLVSKEDSGEMKHKKQYNKSYIHINPRNSFDKTHFQILCIWYTCDQIGTLNMVQSNAQKLIYNSNYVATMKKPNIKRCERSSSISYVLPCKNSEMESALIELSTSP